MVKTSDEVFLAATVIGGVSLLYAIDSIISAYEQP
jgi:hypothetical protein